MKSKLICGLLIIQFAFVTQAREIEQSSRRPLPKKVQVEEIFIAKPFKVRVIQGTIYYGNAEPLTGATFELHSGDGRSFDTKTDAHGRFKLNDVPSGTYDFRASCRNFNPTLGKVIVSASASTKAVIIVTLMVAN